MSWWGKENLVIGDGPADILDVSVDRMIELLNLKVTNPRTNEGVSDITIQELTDIYLMLKVPDRYNALGSQICELVDTAWADVHAEYVEEFNRLANRDEQAKLCEFCFAAMFD